jgi:hypothetical protein
MVGRAEAGFVNGVLQKTTNPIPKPLALDRFHANILGRPKLGVWPILDTSDESARGAAWWTSARSVDVVCRVQSNDFAGDVVPLHKSTAAVVGWPQTRGDSGIQRRPCRDAVTDLNPLSGSI